MLKELKCAAAPYSVRFCVSARLTLLPYDTPHHQPHASARSLPDNRLGSEGAAALAKGLKGNNTLRSLK